MNLAASRVLLHVYQNNGVDDAVYIADALNLPLSQVEAAVKLLGPEGGGLIETLPQDKLTPTTQFFDWLNTVHRPDLTLMGHIIDKAHHTSQQDTES